MEEVEEEEVPTSVPMELAALEAMLVASSRVIFSFPFFWERCF